jgi:hypothetical protein
MIQLTYFFVHAIIRTSLLLRVIPAQRGCHTLRLFIYFFFFCWFLQGPWTPELPSSPCSSQQSQPATSQQSPQTSVTPTKSLSNSALYADYENYFYIWVSPRKKKKNKTKICKLYGFIFEVAFIAERRFKWLFWLFLCHFVSLDELCGRSVNL